MIKSNKCSHAHLAINWHTLNKRLSLMAAMGLLIAHLFAVQAVAAEDIYPLATGQQQQQFSEILHELRCLVCQNESLAESNSPLAQDLRQQVYEMVRDGKTDREIKDFLVNRYGDFVLFKPEFSPRTYILWIGPFIMLILGFVIIYLTFRRRNV